MFMAIMIAVVFVTSCGSKPKEKPKVQEIPKAVDSDNSSNEIKKSNEEK